MLWEDRKEGKEEREREGRKREGRQTGKFSNLYSKILKSDV